MTHSLRRIGLTEPGLIRIARSRLRLTQRQLAQLLGVHWITVSRWERGVSAATAWQLDLISELSNVTDRKRVATAKRLLSEDRPIHALGELFDGIIPK